MRAVHDAICAGTQPHLTLLLLPPLASSLFRARRRNQRHIAAQGTDENRFEREGDSFYERVYRQYEEIARREPRRVLAIREDAPIEAIAAQILSAVLERFDLLSAVVSSESTR